MGKSSENGLSSFQALATAIAAQVGTGKHCHAMHTFPEDRAISMWVSASLVWPPFMRRPLWRSTLRVKENGVIVGGPCTYKIYF